MRVLRSGRLVLLLAAVLAALLLPSSAGAQAPAQPSCKAEGLFAGILVIPLPVVTANPAGTPCATDDQSLVVGDLGLLSIGAVQASTSQTPATGPSDRRARSASASVADVDVDLVLDGLLDADALQSAVTARCVGGAAQVNHTSRVQGLRLLGQPIAGGLDQVVERTAGPLGTIGIRLDVNRWEPNATTTGGTQTPLRLRVSVAGVPTVDLTLGRSSASVDGVDCTVTAPTVVVTDAGVNRAVTALVTPGTNPVETTTLGARPVGSTGAFTPLAGVTYDAATNRLTGTLPRATFPPGDYEIRATGADADGRVAQATGVVTVRTPVVGSPVVSDRTITTSVTAPPATTLTDCAVTLVPAGGGATTTLAGTFTGANCLATAPDALAAGSYEVATTVTDANGDTGTGSATGTVGAAPAGPTVALASGANRTVAATTTPGTNGPATACTIAVRPQGSSAAFTGLDTTLAGGRCTADLPRATYAPGVYEVRVTATDATDRTGSATGTVTIAAPIVGPVTVDDRTASAPVSLAPGTTADACSIRVSDASGTVAEIDGTFDPATSTCSGDIPETVSDGAYDVEVTVTDDNGDSGTGRVEDAIVGGDAAPAAPTVTFADSGRNRVAAAAIDTPAGESVTSCTATVRKDGAEVPVAATYDAATKRCTAQLPSADFGVGDHQVTFTVATSGGGSASVTGTLTIAAPQVEAPQADGRVIEAEVIPASGTTIASCSITLTRRDMSTTLAGTYDSGARMCRATAPAEVGDGVYDATVDVMDSNGDTARQTRSITIGGAPSTPTTPTTPGTPTAPTTPAPKPSGPSFTTGTAADLLTGCSDRRVVLVDVYRVRGGVRIKGVANRALIGKTVTVTASGRKGAIAKLEVDKTGTYARTVRLRGIAGKTRFTAAIGRERSSALKLGRRLMVSSAGARSGKVTVKGMVTSPRPKAGQRLELRRLVACGAYERVGTAKLTRSGRFTAKVTAPNARVGIFRVMTKVPRKPGGRATATTYSLPVVVSLG